MGRCDFGIALGCALGGDLGEGLPALGLHSLEPCVLLEPAKRGVDVARVDLEPAADPSRALRGQQGRAGVGA